MIESLAQAILRHVKARAVAGQAGWAAAMEAESQQPKSSRERLAWALGCLVASYRMKPPLGALGYVLGLLLAMGLVGLFNWRADEGGIDMGVLVISSLVLGVALPRMAWLSGLLVGLVIFSQSVFAAATGLHPVWVKTPALMQKDPDFSLLILVAPALVAALLGGWIGRITFRRPR
jgi:hypothetical protein